MARLLVFALFADERLEFGRGLSTEEEPDLWRNGAGKTTLLNLIAGDLTLMPAASCSTVATSPRFPPTDVVGPGSDGRRRSRDRSKA